jgi:hypothetical protein
MPLPDDLRDLEPVVLCRVLSERLDAGDPEAERIFRRGLVEPLRRAWANREKARPTFLRRGFREVRFETSPPDAIQRAEMEGNFKVHLTFAAYFKNRAVIGREPAFPGFVREVMAQAQRDAAERDDPVLMRFLQSAAGFDALENLMDLANDWTNFPFDVEPTPTPDLTSRERRAEIPVPEAYVLDLSELSGQAWALEALAWGQCEPLAVRAFADATGGLPLYVWGLQGGTLEVGDPEWRSANTCPPHIDHMMWESLSQGGFDRGAMLGGIKALVITSGEKMAPIAWFPDSVYEAMVDANQRYVAELADNSPGAFRQRFLDELDRLDSDLARRFKKLKLPPDVITSYAISFFSDVYGLRMVREAMGEWGYPGSRATLILEVTREDLENIGIARGSRWWERAPWKLVNLPAPELAQEGVLMRHCVGRYDMGYRDAVELGQTWIWSLRSRFNQPALTWEINVDDWEAAENEIERAHAIAQLKGPMNVRSGQDFDEVRIVRFILAILLVDEHEVGDFMVGEVREP